jgi:hypothetical protein
MNGELRTGPGFWRTVWLLLGAARTRAAGRRIRQQELLQSRSGKNATDWGGIGFAFAVLFMALISVGAAWVVSIAVEAGERFEAERLGKIIVSRRFLDAANIAADSFLKADEYLASYYSSEAQRIAKMYGGTQAVVEEKLRYAVRIQGTRGFATAVIPAKPMAAEQQGKIVVSREFLFALSWAETHWYEG